MAFLFFRCSNETVIVDNSEIVAVIDSMSFNETIYTIDLDSKNNVIDTTKVEKIKKDEKGNIIYIDLIHKDINESESSYYRNNGELFLKITKRNNDYYSKYETFLNSDSTIMNVNTLIVKNGTDTTNIPLKYIHTFDENGKKQATTITSQIDSLDTNAYIFYNEHEKPTQEITLFSADTLYELNYHYDNGKLLKKTYRKGEVITTESYNDSEKIVEKSKYIKNPVQDKVLKTMRFEYDDKGNLISIISLDSNNKIIDQSKKIIIENI